MPYRLEHDESVPRGFRRIAREEIDAAVAHLRVTQASKRDEAVHEARKCIKKLRGLVRLLAPELGADGQTENVALRDLGRTLSEVRDAAAMIETVDLIGKKYHDDPAIVKLARVRSAFVKKRNAARRQADSTSAAQDGIVGLRQLRRRLNDWTIGTDFASLAPGLKKTYRRGKHALERARKHPDSENLHDLRKRVKDYWYQVRLLENLWAEDGKSPESALKDLQEWLGDVHNLAVLREKAVAGSEGVSHLIEDMWNSLRDKSLDAAKELYSGKSGEHVDRIAKLWTAWREEQIRKTARTAEGETRRAISAA